MIMKNQEGRQTTKSHALKGEKEIVQDLFAILAHFIVHCFQSNNGNLVLLSFQNSDDLLLHPNYMINALVFLLSPTLDF